MRVQLYIISIKHMVDTFDMVRVVSILIRPQLVKTLVIVIRAHVVKVYNNYA